MKLTIALALYPQWLLPIIWFISFYFFRKIVFLWVKKFDSAKIVKVRWQLIT